MKSEKKKKNVFRKEFSSKYKDDEVKYKQQYSSPEFENNSVSALSKINELDSTDPLEKPFNIEEERNKMSNTKLNVKSNLKILKRLQTLYFQGIRQTLHFWCSYLNNCSLMLCLSFLD